MTDSQPFRVILTEDERAANEEAAQVISGTLTGRWNPSVWHPVEELYGERYDIQDVIVGRNFTATIRRGAKSIAGPIWLYAGPNRQYRAICHNCQDKSGESIHDQTGTIRIWSMRHICGEEDA